MENGRGRVEFSYSAIPVVVSATATVGQFAGLGNNTDILWREKVEENENLLYSFHSPHSPHSPYGLIH